MHEFWHFKIGSFSGIIIKLVDHSISIEESFNHPWFQVFVMFIGESACILVHFFTKIRAVRQYGSFEDTPEAIEAKSNGLIMDYHPIICSIPMFIDLLSSLLLFIAYINIPASFVQMINAFVIFVVALEARLILNQPQFKHHIFGGILAIIGTIIVALAVFISEKDSMEGNTLIGVVAILISVVGQASHAITEEYIIRKYYITPFQFAGWEGIWGTVMYFNRKILKV